LEIPERLGPYRLDHLLGSGGMGAVWRAWDERLKRWVALKQIRADVTLRHGRERLWREARAAARLNHPSIVHVYDILEGTDGDWIVMELVQGKTVRRLLDEETALPPARAVKLCREITEGLAEAHAQGILHRDLKATNVIVAPSGRAKILDFGLAKEIPREGVLEESRDLTISVSGNILGTCYAMSPEQALGRALDERSDLFSLGSLLYEMLTGKAPFRAETAALSLARVVEFRPPPVQRLQSASPPEVCELVDWLLQKEPGDRPKSAAEVLAALDSAAGASGPGREITAFRPAPPPQLDESTLVTRAARAARPAEPVRPADPPRPDEGQRQSGGERRTVTIVCCSLVQLDRSSGEAGALEMEALSEAAVTFESLGREICRELSGSLNAVLNRTVWLCFGYPQAHEDDAERAVRAARELQARFAALPVSAAHRIAVRTGVHTGPAVVVTRPSAGQTLQPGDTFDIATAIQSQVPAGRIGMSAASRQLLGRKFATQPLPAVHLQDLDATVDVYELGLPVERESQEEGAPLPLVNRDAEIQILLDRFRLAVSGSGQAVLIAGEAGIGKSRLVRALSERLAAEAPVWLIAHGSTYAQNTPLAPILYLLSRAIFAAAPTTEGGAEDSAGERLRRLEELLDEHGLPRTDYAPFLGALLSLPVEERYPPLVLSPEARRKRTLAAILALLGALAERHPVVLVIEDLHWIDPSTLEFLDLLLGEIAVLPLLLVATFRPEFTAPWRHQTSVTQLNLGGLSETHAAQLVQQVAEGKGLPAEMRREIVVRTDGIPLFVEELTKAVLEAAEAAEAAETAAPLRGPSGIPFTLGSSLLARLDRLGEAKAVAQLASVIGRTFTLEQLEALSWIKGAALRSALGRLLQAEILHRRGPAQGARYIFKHALIQDAAYLSLLASDRQQLHRRLARLIQEEFPAVAGAEPELMAHHCERGGLILEAIEHLRGAGQRAVQRSAYLEAMSHVNHALDLLLGLPAAPERAMTEIALRAVLAPALAATKGWGAPEVAVSAERLVALCREIGNRDLLIPSLYGLWAHHVLRGDRHPASERADEIAHLAETPVHVFIGCSARVHTNFYSGRFAEALALAEQAAVLYEPNLLPEFAQVFGEESSLLPHVYEFWVLWILGRPDAAVRKQEEVLATAEVLRSPFLLGFALLFSMILWHELRDVERVAGLAERLLALTDEQEFLFLRATALCGKGWAACQRGEVGEAATIQSGLELHWATGARLTRGYYLSFLIDAHLSAGRIAEGLAATREALARSETQLDVFFDAELLRLEGELLRASGDAGAAEAAFLKALGIAREQGSPAFELRTAASLVRLLAEQDRAGEALPSLAAVCDAFTEGFATRDLIEARGLLDRLS
jgi:class 3 adenylate cyclase/tetratricopeptide (TPR) repeat protein